MFGLSTIQPVKLGGNRLAVGGIRGSCKGGSVTPPPDPTINILATTLNQFYVAGDATDNFLFPNLVTASDSFQIENCAGQTTLNLPLATSLGTFVVNVNPNLITLMISSIANVSGGQMLIESNPLLTVIVFNSGLRFANDGSEYDFDQNALNAATVNQILHLFVLSGVTTLTINVSGGTNAAPTGQGITDKATLIAAGNSITTN